MCVLILLCLSAIPAHGQTITPLPFPDEKELLNPLWARPGHAPAAQPFMNRTRYLLALDVDYPNGKITGQARILFVNNTPDNLAKAVFRLYPNHPIPAAYGQSFSKPRMLIQAVQLDGAAIPIQLRDNYKTVLDVPFPQGLPVGGSAEIIVSYTVQYAAPNDTLDVRQAFPLLAVYESGWREDIMTKSLDYVYSDVGLFAVTLRAPNNVALYTTGAITRTEADGNRVIYHITTGPVRDYVFVLTKGWGFVRGGESAPVAIDIRFKGTVGVANEIAQLAVASFNYYDQTFGPYLYSHLTILALVYPSGGEEYPTLLFIDTSRDTPYRRFIVAHEVAHQWFYGIAGNDVARHAWLDESMAQIAMYLFYLDTYGKDVAEREWANILTWANRLKGAARPIDTPVEDFADFSEYMVHTYGLGSQFLRELGEKMGWSRFKAGLSEYYQNAALKTGTPGVFYEAMQGQAPELDLKPLFCQKLGTNCS